MNASRFMPYSTWRLTYPTFQPMHDIRLPGALYIFFVTLACSIFLLCNQIKLAFIASLTSLEKPLAGHRHDTLVPYVSRHAP